MYKHIKCNKYKLCYEIFCHVSKDAIEKLKLKQMVRGLEVITRQNGWYEFCKIGKYT